VPVAVTSFTPCPTCRGTGAEPGTEPIVCPVCQGRGVESQGQGLFSITRPCSHCGGSGTVIERPCHTCHGEGRQRELKRYKVNIPAGVKDGSRIRLAGKGEAGLRGGAPGDLYVVTRVNASPVFSPKGDNLEVEIPITVVEALRGAEVEVPTLNGTKTLRVKPGTRHGTTQRLRGEGPPRLDGGGRGDIHYRFTIDVPPKLNAEQREAVEDLARVMNGNPRERVLRDAAASVGGAR
jgi:molecular chaperone DnaJ